MRMVVRAVEKPLERLFFDSDVHSADDRFARYREFYSGGSDAIEVGPVFQAKVRGWRLDRVTLYDRRLQGVAHVRDAERVRRDAFEHFTLTINLSGQFEVDAGGGAYRLATGEAVLMDMREPMRNRAIGAHVVTIGFARDRIATAAGSAEGLHGRILRERQIGLLGDYVRVLIGRLDQFQQDMLVPATRALGSLLAMAFVGEPSLENSTAAAIKDERIAVVHRLIDRNIANPAFGPDAVIAASGISRSNIYRLFQAYGGLKAVILQRRLELVRGGLADAADPRSFARISQDAGFVSESHCSRLFQATYGLRPNEYRTTALQSETDPKLGRRMKAWQNDLR